MPDFFEIEIEDNGFTRSLNALVLNLENVPEDALQSAGEILVESVLMNFEVGGRPAWTPNKAGTKTLWKSGALARAGSNIDVGENYVIVSGWSDLPYAAIQNFGGTIRHPGSSKLQVWKGEGKTIFSQGTKPHEIPIPARQFVLWQPEDEERIAELFGQEILKTNAMSEE